MKDRIRHFTIGLGAVGEVRITATDRKTRQWANRNRQVFGVIFREMHKAMAAGTLARDPGLGFAAAVPVETPTTLAARFARLMQAAFEEETFDVRAAVG